MINANKMLYDFEVMVKQLDYVKFSDIANLIRFKEYLNRIIKDFNKAYPSVSITAATEIVNKTTIRFKAKFTTTDYFYPYKTTIEFFHDYHVFSRGKRNEEMTVKLPLELINIAVNEALEYMNVDGMIFMKFKKINGNIVFSKEQREVIDNIDMITWGSFKFQDLKNVVVTHSWQNPNKVPVFLNKHWWNQLNTKPSTPTVAPKVKAEKKTEVKKEEAVASCCFNCKKWCSSRNSIEMQKQNRIEAPCPVVGKRTKNTDHCGKFRKI